MSMFDWYRRAQVRAEQFLPDLDPELEVDVDDDAITPYDGGEIYETFVLVFSHPTNSRLNWTMAVKPEEDFINHELEQVVRRIYFERVE